MGSGASTANGAVTENLPVDKTLRRFLGYRLKRAYNTIRSELLGLLEPLGLRITTYSALVLIVDNPGLRQSVLAAALDIKRSNMVAIVDELETKGWVTRKEHPSDRRALALHVTKTGSRTCKRALAVCAEHESNLLESMNSDELIQLLTTLEKIESLSEASQ